MAKATRTVLEVRVEGVNLANAEANRLRPILKEAFRPFVGQKIDKASGGLLEKIDKIIKPLLPPFTNRLHVYRSTGGYTLMYYVKTCISYNGLAYYHESPVYVGDIRGGVLEKIADDSEPMREDYSVDEVDANRRAYVAAKHAADEAESKLHPFGEYDR